MGKKFKPELKFKINSWLFIPIFHPTPGGVPSPQVFEIARVIHYNIYNRNNIKYLLRLTNGKLIELHKEYVEQQAKEGNKKSLNILYGSPE